VAHGDDTVAEPIARNFTELAGRRKLGEPIAYLVGQREFWGLNFAVNPHVLIPRPETELLVQWVVEHAPRNAKVLELGTGSGCIAISVAHERPDLIFVATDISTKALLVAQSNAALNNVVNRIEWIESDWYNNIQHKTEFDLIVCNPPYIAADDLHLSQGDLRFEPLAALTDHATGLSAIKRIVEGANYHLKPQCRLALEHGFDQGNGCRALLIEHKFSDVQTLKDLEHRDRISVGRLP
jgi:release factor glutamine methyltransferase